MVPEGGGASRSRSLIDLLHRSNPWSGQDCQRDLCLHCQTKAKTGKYKTQDCTKRNCIYETWCMTCQEEEEKRIEEESGGDEKKMKEMVKKMKLYKYIGETSRSVYERSWEHMHSMEQLQTNSHMLKHALEKHGEEEDLGKIQFGVKVVRYTRSSFVRQVTESVIIQEERNHNILNSKSEYNRCSLPRLTANLGDREWKKRAKEEKIEKERDLELEKRIVGLRKDRNQKRRGGTKPSEEPAEKRRRIGEDEWKRVLQNKETGEKRKENDDDQNQTRQTANKEQKKRRLVEDIRNYFEDTATKETGKEEEEER